jgi:hypothetical protein
MRADHPRSRQLKAPAAHRPVPETAARRRMTDNYDNYPRSGAW